MARASRVPSLRAVEHGQAHAPLARPGDVLDLGQELALRFLLASETRQAIGHARVQGEDDRALLQPVRLRRLPEGGQRFRVTAGLLGQDTEHEMAHHPLRVRLQAAARRLCRVLRTAEVEQDLGLRLVGLARLMGGRDLRVLQSGIAPAVEDEEAGQGQMRLGAGGIESDGAVEGLDRSGRRSSSVKVTPSISQASRMSGLARTTLRSCAPLPPGGRPGAGTGRS
jgi:hypothetical protein